jgi:MFS family permease
MMTSLATQYWHALLSQAFCIGIGGGFLCVPALSLLTQYFSRKQALATGITVIGSSFGGVVYPLAFQGLVDTVGFGWANRVVGLMSLATSSFAVLVMRQRVTPRKVRSLVDWSAFRDPSYNFYCMAMFFMNLGFMVPIVYLQIYAMSNGLTDTKIALHLVAILNAASIPGRLAAAFIVPVIGPINTMLLVTCLVSVVTFSWTAVNTAAGNVLFAVAYGFTSGGIVSLPAVLLTSITPDLRFVGARMGTSFLMTAAASLSGTPIAGTILRTTGKYIGIQLFSGFTMAMGVCCVIAILMSRPGARIFDKA